MNNSQALVECSEWQGNVTRVSVNKILSCVGDPIYCGKRPLGFCAIFYRPNTIEARPMCYLSLSYDHRVIDGKTADDFLARIKHSLEADSRD